MTAETSASSEASARQTPLESWKEIAAYLQRDVSTVRRWEKSEELPVHRHRHNARSSIYAYRGELDAWRAARRPEAEQVLPREPLWRQPLPSLAFSLALVLALVSVGNGLILQPVQVSAQVPGPTMTARRIWVGPDINFYGMGSPSRDGRSLSFRDRRSLAVRDLTSGETRRLKEPSDPAEQAEFSVVSPDGKWIAYEWDIGDFDELRMMAVDGSEDRVLYQNPETESIQVQDWSPDQKRLVVVRRLKDQTWQIALVSAADGSLQVLRSLEWRYPFKVSFSPDGSYIAYDLPVGKDSRARDIFLMSSDGSRETRLVRHPAADVSPVWSPNGNRILFESDRTGDWSLWALAVKNGKPQGRAELITPNIGPCLSPCSDARMCKAGDRHPRRASRQGVSTNRQAAGVREAMCARLPVPVGTPAGRWQRSPPGEPLLLVSAGWTPRTVRARDRGEKRYDCKKGRYDVRAARNRG